MGQESPAGSLVRAHAVGEAGPLGWVSITEHLPLLLRAELCAMQARKVQALTSQDLQP